MAHFNNLQDWETVTFTKPPAKSNTNNSSKSQKYEYKADSEQATSKPKVDRSLSIEIQQTRTRLKLSRKELARSLNIQENILATWETGKADYDGKILNKIKTWLQKNCNQTLKSTQKEKKKKLQDDDE